MSFNRLNYDIGTYKQDINQSVGPGYYHINPPKVDCEPCYPNDPNNRLQYSGGSIQRDIFMIDVDSELLGLTRKNSNNPKKKYTPCCPDTACTNGEICGKGVNGACKAGNNLLHFKDCSIPIEDTRLTNPPCNLRGTGINRWEWLCSNPQDRIELPFDWNISNRIIVKDNHRPIIPTPISPEPLLPENTNLPCEETLKTCGNYTQPRSVHWKSCNEIKKY